MPDDITKTCTDPGLPFASTSFAIFSSLSETGWCSERLGSLLAPREITKGLLVQGATPRTALVELIRERLVGVERSLDEVTTERSVNLLIETAPKAVQATLCPLGLVHIYRQHIYEGQTFLGPAIDHVWLSPGSSLELIETKVVRTATEKTLETLREIRASQEDTSTELSELATRLATQRTTDTRLGCSVSASGGFGVVSSSVNATASSSNTLTQAHEQMQKQTQSRSSKVTQEQRTSVKTTVKTTTEQTTTTQRRHLLNNNTEKLVSYALHLKMRKVLMRAQYVGARMCWVTYVQNPASLLSTSKLLQVPSPKDLDSLLASQPKPPEGSCPKEDNVEFSFFQADEEHKLDAGAQRTIDLTYLLPRGCCYVWAKLNDDNENGLWNFDVGDGAGRIIATKITGKGGYSTHPGTAHYKPLPGAVETWNQQQADYEQSVDLWRQSVRDAQYQNFVETAAKRINALGAVPTRDPATLRQEERIALLRKLTWDLQLGAAAPALYSDVLSQLFDLDEIFFFLAPDWYQPTKTMITPPPQPQSGKQGRGEYGQALGADPIADDLVDLGDFETDWGTSKHGRPYSITSESEPAPLGASLGWLIQVDGDEQRQAFLNAPYIKVVVPLRPHAEAEAIKWLSILEGGVDDTVSKKVSEAITNVRDLYKDENKRARAMYSGGTPPTTPTVTLDENEPAPLRPDGICSEWIEVLPTNQVVPVPVSY